MDPSPTSPTWARAQDLAYRGYKVFPCVMNGKNPATPNGFHDASNNLNDVDAWWEENPLYNVGVPCGSVNNLTVLDADMHGADGIESLRKLVSIIGDNLTEYPGEFTPSGGVHYFFSDNDLPTLRKFTLYDLPGLEVRGEGSYVVVTPSTIYDGYYSHFPNGALVDERVPRPMPPKLREIILVEQAPRVYGYAPATFGALALYDHVHCEGERNNAIFKLACDLQGQGMYDDDIVHKVMQYNVQWCDPPQETKEVMRTIDSALRYEKGTRTKKQLAIEDDKPFVIKRPGKPARVIQETEYKDLAWIIPDLLPIGATQLVGPAKVGKSWFCLQLAIAVASGGTFLRRGLERRRVLYLDLEDGERRVKNRLETLHANPNMYGDYFDIVDPIDFRNDFHSNLALPKCIDGMREVIKLCGYELVIVDIVGRAFPLMDHNEFESVLACLVPYQEMAQELDVSLLFVDHTRKNLSKDEDHLLQVGGSRGKSATYDTTMSLCRKRNEMMGKLKVTGRDMEDVVLDVKHSACMWFMQTEMERLGERENKIIEIVRILKDEATTQKILDRFNDWYVGEQDRSAMQPNNLSPIMNALVTKGWLVRTKGPRNANIYALGPKVLD